MAYIPPYGDTPLMRVSPDFSTNMNAPYIPVTTTHAERGRGTRRSMPSLLYGVKVRENMNRLLYATVSQEGLL